MMAFAPSPWPWSVCMRVIHCIFILWVGHSKLDRVKTMNNRGKVNSIWWNIKVNLQKNGSYIMDINCEQICKISYKDLNQSENIQKKFRGRLLFCNTLYTHSYSECVTCSVSSPHSCLCVAGQGGTDHWVVAVHDRRSHSQVATTVLVIIRRLQRYTVNCSASVVVSAAACVRSTQPLTASRRTVVQTSTSSTSSWLCCKNFYRATLCERGIAMYRSN